MTKTFLIPIIELDASWCMRGFSHTQYAQEYCVKILKIPIECIAKSQLSRNGLKVEIDEVEKIATEPWYIKLLSLSKN